MKYHIIHKDCIPVSDTNISERAFFSGTEEEVAKKWIYSFQKRVDSLNSLIIDDNGIIYDALTDCIGMLEKDIDRNY